MVEFAWNVNVGAVSGRIPHCFCLAVREFRGSFRAWLQGEVAMLRRLALPVALAALLSCSPPQSAKAPEAPAVAAAAPAAPVEAPAGAATSITAWYRQRLGATLIEPVDIFYGDFTGDGAPDALAWGYFNTDGNMTDHVLALFRNDAGAMTFVREDASVQGSEPRDVAFAPGRVTLTTKVALPSDPGCCPTGSQDWVINAN